MMTIMACEAGKDVYVEKPMTTTVEEGRRLVEATRRHARVVQVGIQQRTMPVFEHAIVLVHAGRLGRILRTRAWSGANAAAPIEARQDPPDGLDWDMWLGPAPWVPYSPQRHYGFRAFRDYAGGELTNWGVHLLDINLWAMQQHAPLSIQALAAPGAGLSGEDPIGMEIIYEFKGCTMTWSQSTNGFQFEGQGLGNLIEGSLGRATVTRAFCRVRPESLGIADFQSTGFFNIALSQHHDDFFRCMRTRQRPQADCEIGHRATTICNIGNIAMEMRRKLRWNGETERFVDDEAANRKLHRPTRAPWYL